MIEHQEPQIEPGRLLSALTSWRIGGPAAWFAEPDNVEQLEACLAFAESRRIPVLALGGGSNVLVSDQGYPGLIVRCGGRNWKVRRGSGDQATVRAGARAPLASLARDLARGGWGGLEWAEGIPGTVGGAVIGNAGAFGGEIAGACAGCLTWSRADGEREWAHDDIGFAYRHTRFTGQDPTTVFLLEASFRVRRDDPQRLLARVREIGTVRKERSPVGLSCGSVFRNPPGDSAGRLIDACGLKGTRHGAAKISERHANYILNRGGATASDVRALIDLARARVRQDFGIELQLEVRLVGFAGEAPGG